ncbi:MAG: efflux RND transporter periplasmic adaptor subunit [Nitrosomonadales bacterium]|nr:efflux RND transporter periplasmic adaptor subunit [Nitrosomonadales bacterium]
MKNIDKKNKQRLAILAVVIIGLVLGSLILKQEKPDADHAHGAHTEPADRRPAHGEPGHDHEKDHLPLAADPHEAEHSPQPQESAKGPRGGKLFTQDGFGVEVTIFERNIPSEFRLYTYLEGKPLSPSASNVSMQLQRLGKAPQQIGFSAEHDYLKSDVVIEEPHSFNASITVEHGGESYRFAYEQVEARVRLSDRQLMLNSIEVLTAGPAKIKSTLNLQGEIKRNADKNVHVVPRLDGIVDSVAVNAGDQVHKGQLLVTISSQAIADMRSDLLAAQKRAGLARLTFEREKQLWEEKISAEQDYLQARHDLQEAEINLGRAQQKLSAVGAGTGTKGQTRYEIRSPIDGVVTNKQISQGQVVNALDKILEVADLTSVWVEMMIYAKDIGTVKVGQNVTIKASAFDAQAIGTISYVGALVGGKSRTAMARLVLNNPDGIWLAGLPVNIELISDEVAVPLAVSVEGIQTLNDWIVVFGRYGEYFEARPLQLGRRDDKYVEVLNGLSVGEKYAAGNSFLIKADIGKEGATHDH